MLVNQCGFWGSSIVRPPLHGGGCRGGGREGGGKKKAARLFKGTEGLASGREWRLEGGGGGSRSAVQQYQPPSTEEAPQTLAGGRGHRVTLVFPPVGLLLPSCQFSQETFSLHHFVAGIFPVGAGARSALRQSARIIIRLAPDASGALSSSALQCREPGRRCSLPLTRAARRLHPREPEPRQPGEGGVFALWGRGAGGCGGRPGSRNRLGGPGRERDGEIVEDGSQRVHGGRTGPLSLPRTHVSFTFPLTEVFGGRPQMRSRGSQACFHKLLLGCCV